MAKTRTLSYGRHYIDEEDIESIVQAIRKGTLTQGPIVGEFEKALAKRCGAKYAVAVNSGTSALHIACLAAGIGPGEEVITSPITFVASSNCAFYVGATPVFADIDAKTALIDPKKIAEKMNAKTRAIVPVHFAGQSASMKEIQALAKQAEAKFGKKVFVIEDDAHALGGMYDGAPVGSCKYSDMACLSFHPVKHITTFEGGAVLTNDEELYKKLLMYRSHGITRDADAMQSDEYLPWGYEQQLLGFNYRIPDIQCAVGISQLKKLDFFVKRRRELAAKYRKAFEGSKNYRVLEDYSDRSNSYHLFVVLLPFEKFGGRNKVMQQLRELGIIAQVHYIPVHTQPYYRERLKTKKGDFPIAETYFSQCLSIPLFPGMTDEDFDYSIEKLNQVIPI